MQNSDNAVRRRRQRSRVQGGWASYPTPTTSTPPLPHPTPHTQRPTHPAPFKHQPRDGEKQRPQPTASSQGHSCQLPNSPPQTADGQGLPRPQAHPELASHTALQCPAQPPPSTSQWQHIQKGMVSQVPRSFSWVEEGLLCGLAFPDRPQQIQYLLERNVHHLVNLTQDRVTPTHSFPDLRVVRISIHDFTAPTLDQIKQFLEVVHQAKQKQEVAAVVQADAAVWVTLCACYFIDFHNMSTVKAAAHACSVLKESPLSREMMDVVEEFQSAKSGIPWKFSWVVKDLLCALAFPGSKADLNYLVNNNIAYLVSLTQERDPDVDNYPDLMKVDLKMAASSTPDMEQVVEFLTLVDLAEAEKKAVAVHCSDGLGRTGAMLACYFVQRQVMTAAEAVDRVRELRPGSLGSRSQEVLVAEYETYRRKVPRRFSWLVRGRLCALAFPEEREHLQYLVDHGVGYLVCLTEERDPDTEGLTGLEKVNIKMKDFSSPDQHQVNKFLSLMERAAQQHKGVALHCAGGRGRTGTLIACYLVKEEGLSAAAALRRTRDLRPGSVETKDQEQVIYDFEKTIRQMPDNFSWVVDGLLCTLAFPETRQNLRYLLDNNVAYLVSLTAERDPPVTQCPELELVSLKIQDFSPPTMEQVEEFLDILHKAGTRKKAVALHCAQGQGRTGTMIACYLVKVQRLSAAEAIQKTRWLRRGSIETSEQERMVHDYKQHLIDSGQFHVVC
ncbi:uncharacterized protein LOC124115604 [Haliotis rufescens]|uniref:uncharacterized protein LOC124115604 n=1 Tax=Haliotis rufescens TaxID=6454 RepID=UPI00201EB63C|nr:uncharacterized protein LOC124115604 [Haliotis rufescens]